MTFATPDRPLSGVLVPLSALRTASTIGSGEFADLPALAQWCVATGLDMIQILPVNDTGWQASPYSALSAFALHPLYLRVADLPEIELLRARARTDVEQRLNTLRDRHANDRRLRYGPYMDAKRAVLRCIWYEVFELADAGTPPARAIVDASQRFFDDRLWIAEYAAFKTLKIEHAGASWREWAGWEHPDADSIRALFDDPARRRDLLYYGWLQMRLHEQFAAAADAVAVQGVLLKGDIPIMVNDDSADFWAHRDYFSDELRAGAPPDGGNPLGQNWGLPTYDWNALERDDYRWWRDRLIAADRFYAAYRIDHVLGFFRIWGVAVTNDTGALGRFVPGVSADLKRLAEYGMDCGRVRWLAEPHLSGSTLVGDFGDEAEAVRREALVQIDGEDLYLFAESIRGERDIARLPVSDHAKTRLAHHYRDRALISVGADGYVPTWCFGDCSRFRALNDDERAGVARLARDLMEESTAAWEAQARKLLGFMQDTTGMLACAEDLGAIPDCVPDVLSDLGILGLRIPRWTRRWTEGGQPYISPADYPPLTVCAPSVHDTSTLREWWLSETDRDAFWRTLGLDATAPSDYTPETARAILGALFEGSSRICVVQLQDLFALVAGMTMDEPEAERVNVPGTLSDFNWGYRANHTIEELLANDELTGAVHALATARRKM